MPPAPTATAPLGDPLVLVVGAGPAGLSTALSLARQHIPVVVVERHPATSIFPRATALSTRSMEILRSWGLEEAVRRGGMDIQPLMSISATLTDSRQAVVPIGYPSDEDALALSPTTPCWCPQDHLEPVLADHLVDAGGQLLFDTEVVAVDQGPDAVTVVLDDRPTGRRRTSSVAYVVAADGARSTIRAGLGISMDGPDNLGNYVSALFHADLSTIIGPRTYALHRIDGPLARGMFLPTSRHDRWVYGHEWHPEHGEAVADYTVDRMADLIRAAAGVADLDPHIVAIQSFEFAAQVASSVREGRVFLIGDAAHRMTPIGGMGLNTAIGDAHNLAWKLAAVLDGRSGAAILDTYAAERRPIGLHNTLRSMRPSEQSARDGLTDDLGIAYTSAAVASTHPCGPADHPAAPGKRAPHIWLDLGGRRLSTLDLFDGRHTLLIGRDGNVPPPGPDAAAVVALRCDHDFVDPADTFHTAYGIEPAGAVLVRPDGHVAWWCPTGRCPADVRGTVRIAAAAGAAPGLVESGTR